MVRVRWLLYYQLAFSLMFEGHVVQKDSDTYWKVLLVPGN